MIGAVHRELPDIFQLQPQLLDGIAALLQLLPGCHALHGDDPAAHLHIGGGQFQENVQPCNRPAGGDVIALPPVCHRFLCPGGDAGGFHAQLGQNFFQPVNPFPQAVQQGHVQLRAADGQGHAGESRAAAHVNELLPGKIAGSKHSQAVQQMQLGNLTRLGNGGKVHHLILLDDGASEIAKGLFLLFRQVQPQSGQPGGQGLHHFIHISTAPLR